MVVVGVEPRWGAPLALWEVRIAQRCFLGTAVEAVRGEQRRMNEPHLVAQEVWDGMRRTFLWKRGAYRAPYAS